MSALKAALEAAGISIRGYNPAKNRSIQTHSATITISGLAKEIQDRLGKQLPKYPEIMAATFDLNEMEKLVEEYAETELQTSGGANSSSSSFLPHPEVAHLTLNVDTSSPEPGSKKFCCTTADHFIDTEVSAQHYLSKCRLNEMDATAVARPIVKRYMPRKPPGIYPTPNPVTQLTTNYLNSYVPASWDLWRRRNPAEWKKLPAKCPAVVLKLLKHLIPDPEERKYFYAWTYTSMASRAYVYLVLCGVPGVGKNRLNYLLTALHGKHNATNGKKETFGANGSKFNSQLEGTTLAWFDELKYTREMEPRMKEYQNDSISIERKGVDASRSSPIHCSMVISNNHEDENFILFNSRKFAPLKLGSKFLTESMTSDEIAEMTEKLDDNENNKKFDVRFVAQIAKWIMAVGPKYATRWPNLEYQGPAYWQIAQASMHKWQKISVLALTVQNQRGPFAGWDASKKAFLWSKVEEALRHKKEFESRDYRNPYTVKAFFETYRDLSGQRVFEVEATESNTIRDFWIKPIKGLTPVKGDISLKAGAAGDAVFRPPGLSEYQWKKMQQEHLVAQGGLKALTEEVQDEDANLL